MNNTIQKRIQKRIEEISNEVEEDPTTYEKEEDFYKRYGTLTSEDLLKRVDI